jgi:hypothetical protein
LRFFQGIIIICWGHWHMAILGLFFRIWVYWILVCSPPLEELMLWLFHVRARGLQIGCSVVRRQERVSNFSHLHTLLCCSYTSMGVSGSWLRQKPFIYLFIESSMIFKDVKDDKTEVKLDDNGTPFFVGFGR